MKRICLLITVMLLGSAWLMASASNGYNSVTYTKDIAPIPYKYCAECHRAGGRIGKSDLVLSMPAEYTLNAAGELPPVGVFASIDDSGLKNHRDYQRWKKALFRTEAGRALLSADHRLSVHIRVGDNSAGPKGAETRDYVFDGDELREATIVFGPDFAKNSPWDGASYPVLVSLTPCHEITREALAVAILAHEFGHVQNTRRMGGTRFHLENQLLAQNMDGFFTYGLDWVHRPEYQRIVAKLGRSPSAVRRQREIDAEAFAVPVIIDYFGGKLPVTVRQAIRSYREEYPLLIVAADTQRLPAPKIENH